MVAFVVPPPLDARGASPPPRGQRTAAAGLPAAAAGRRARRCRCPRPSCGRRPTRRNSLDGRTITLTGFTLHHRGRRRPRPGRHRLLRGRRPARAGPPRPDPRGAGRSSGRHLAARSRARSCPARRTRTDGFVPTMVVTSVTASTNRRTPTRTDCGVRGLVTPAGHDGGMATRDDAQAILEQLAGPTATLRDDQWTAIEALVVHRRRALVVQRTGWGKSAVYFIAAKLLRASGHGADGDRVAAAGVDAQPGGRRRAGRGACRDHQLEQRRRLGRDPRARAPRRPRRAAGQPGTA